MSGIAYRPPSENLAIFDSSVFLASEQPLTFNNISSNFLQFPTGQGTETIPSLIVPGTSTLGLVTSDQHSINTGQNLIIPSGSDSGFTITGSPEARASLSTIEEPS